MAAPLAHIFLAVLMLAGPFKGLFNEKEFIIGTSFPDIRYLKVVQRTCTHFANVSLQDIMHEKNSFKAGMLFHSFVDEQREAYVVKNDLYKGLPNFRFTTQSLKFAEDEILRSECDGARYAYYFDEILEEEKAYGIDPQHLRAWHLFLQEYLQGRYSGYDLAMKYFDLNEPHAWSIKRSAFAWFYARTMERVISAITSNPEKRNVLVDFYKKFIFMVSV